MKKLTSFIAGTSIAAAAQALAIPYVTYNGSDNQTPANPTGQGWTVSGSLAQGFTDATNGNTQGWELNDNNSDANPTMYQDYGSGNIPQAGDTWSLTLNCRILPGNGSATNVFQWSNGSVRYLAFLYEDASGNIDIFYANSSGSLVTLQDYVVNDDAFHNWAFVHDGTSAKLTYDGADVVTLGTIAASGQARGIHIGGSSSSGTGALYVSTVNYDATLASAATSTTLGKVFADHMVLQRNEPVKIFGTDSVNPGSQAINVSFNGQTKNTTTDGDGNWSVTLDAMAANATGQTLTVTGSAVTSITDVLVGEVWLAAGQSNMNWRVNQSSNSPHTSTYSLIRMCNWEGVVGTGSSQVYGATDFANLTPDNFYSGTWQTMDATNVQAQSAVAYFFAHNLATDLNVPIGIVDTSYGGTSTEAYISPAAHSTSPYLTEAFERPHLCTNLGQWTGVRLFKNVYNNNVANYTHSNTAEPHPHPYAPGFLYWTGIEHLKNFTFKGAIWYQGESNAEFTSGKYQINGNRLSYYQSELMKTLITDWRSAFGKANFPFYMVQLPRINASSRSMWPFYREAQARVAHDLDGVELATVMEYGVTSSDVHPANKEPVGERLAAIARAKLYGDAITYSGPVYSHHVVSDNKIILHFDHTGGGLTDIDGGALDGFTISGSDRNFVAATATIVGNTVEVTAGSVANPVAVRHAWDMNADVDLYNGDGFSSSSFRTDNWIAAPGRKLKVACIGDSITDGVYVADADDYPSQLQNLLGTDNFEVQNFGNPGYGVYRVAKRYDTTSQYTSAIAYQPDIVICNLGINDIVEVGTFTQDQFETEYFELVDSFAQSGNAPLFIQWNKLAPIYPAHAYYGSSTIDTVNTFIKEAAANTNALMMDMETPLLNRDEWFVSDDIHPNELGYIEIAETTFCFLDQIGDMDGQPFLSEIMANNTSGLQDNDGDYSDWIEISNSGTTASCLNNLYLTNDLGDLDKWQIPTSTVVPPNGQILIFASAKNRTVNGDPLHTNFTLANTGGELALVDSDGSTVLDSLNYPAQHANISYGRSAANNGALVSNAAPVKYLVPSDGTLAATWTTAGFDDSTWTTATAGLSYDQSVTTFTGAQIWNSSYQNSWTELSASATTKGLNGSVLHYDHTGQSLGSSLDGTNATLDGGITTWNTINSGDWTFEINLKVNASPAGFAIWLGTDTQRIVVEIHNDRTQDYGANSFNTAHTNNDGAFHTFKITHDSAGGVYHLWRDGVLLTPAAGAGYDLSGTDSRMLLGDYTSGAFGNGFDVEIQSLSFASNQYASISNTDIGTALYNVNPGVYTRMPFTLGDPSTITALSLNVNYDDGYVAYLNGTEVARSNVTAGQAWNSTSTSDRTDADALNTETVDLSSQLGLLTSGSNVLAIHALNSAADADRFVIKASLTATEPQQTLFFQTPTPDSPNAGASAGITPFNLWKSENGINLNDSDDDGDGVTAFMEFVTGSDPSSYTPNPQPVPTITNDGANDHLTISFRVANNLTGLSHIVEYSDDLVTAPVWEIDSSATLINTSDNGDGSSTLTYRLSPTLTTAGKLFSRVFYSYSE